MVYLDDKIAVMTDTLERFMPPRHWILMFHLLTHMREQLEW
jgi:hypothetical protein